MTTFTEDIAAVEAEHGFPSGSLTGYRLIATLPDGRLCGIERLMFHWTVRVNLDAVGWSEAYCFGDRYEEPVVALAQWDGTGEMPGRWRKRKPLGIERDPDTDERWHESEPRPSRVKERV